MAKPIEVPEPRLTLQDFAALGADEQRFMIYLKACDTEQRIYDISVEAQDMMSPDKMMEIAGQFLGGGM